jgi:hypothetical protein
VKEEAVFPVLYNIGIAAVIADDGRQADAHPLQEGQACGLGPVGGVELDVRIS